MVGPNIEQGNIRYALDSANRNPYQCIWYHVLAKSEAVNSGIFTTMMGALE
jgi:hypothetical protein